jgi:hypothetical protein
MARLPAPASGGRATAIRRAARTHMAHENHRCAALWSLSGFQVELGRTPDTKRVPHRKILLRALPLGTSRSIPTRDPLQSLRGAGPMSRKPDLA